MTPPSNANVGDTVTFSASGAQGSTWDSDTWSGGVDCNGSVWGSKNCNATGPGTFTWTHMWKNCAPNDCTKTSAACSKSVTFTIGGSSGGGTSPSKMYLSTDPGSFSANPLTINPGGTFYVTTTSKNSAPDCSAYITLTPGSSSLTGYTCQGDGRGDTCSSNPVGDGNTCWWQWQCTAGSTPGNYPVTFSSGKSDYSLNPACEAQNNVTVANASTPTPTPTPAATPTPGETITPTSSAGTQLAFTLNLPYATQNQRQLNIRLKPLTGTTYNTTATISYNNSDQTFTGTATLDPSVPSGQYDIYIQTTPYVELIAGQNVTAGQTLTIDESSTPMLVGDINGDWSIDLQDYNALVSCNYGAVNPQPVTKDCQNADLNNDGVVDGIDYNIFIRNWNKAKSVGYE